MTIDNLKCFILVAENLSFARAAEALYISQPAVTKQINTLERELGIPLFIRSTRHVELTPAGMSFYKDAKDIVLNSQMAVKRLQKHNTNYQSIRIGLSNHIVLTYLTKILKKVSEKYPDVRPDIQVHGYKTILSLFMEEKLDILFYYKENMTEKTGITFKELEKDRFVCLMPSDHPYVTKEIITLDDLYNEPIIMCNPLNAPLSTANLQQSISEKCSPEDILYCDCIEIAHSMVAAGMGISIIPSMLSIISSEFTTVPLDDKTELSFGIFYRKKNNNAMLKKVLNLI